MADKQGQYSISDLAPDAAPAGAPATSQAPSKPPKKQGQYSESDLAPSQPDSDYSAVGEFGSTLWNDAKALPANLWHLGGQMLSHPIDTTVQGVNGLLNLPDTLTDEWVQGHPGRAVAHMGELAAPVAVEHLPGLASAVADSDVYQTLRGKTSAAVKAGAPDIAAGAAKVVGADLAGDMLPNGLNWMVRVGLGYPGLRQIGRGLKNTYEAFRSPVIKAGSEEAELDALANQYYNKPFSALTGDDAKTVQAIRNFHRNAAETVPASAPSVTSPAAGAAKTPRPVPTTNLRVRDRDTVMQEVNDKLNLKADVPEGTGEVYKSQGGEAASSHIQSMQAKDAAIAKYLRENPKALGGKRWSELNDTQRSSILQDINKATGKKYTYSPNTAARAGEIDRLLQ